MNSKTVLKRIVRLFNSLQFKTFRYMHSSQNFNLSNFKKYGKETFEKILVIKYLGM